MAATQLDVEFLFSLTATLGDRSHALIRNGPAGTRAIVPVVGGHFEGPKVKGTVVPPGGDWVQVRSRQVSKLDVRIQLVTDDGESILMTYQGISVTGEDGASTIRTAPLFETGAEAYGWLNDIQAVGIGSIAGGEVTYDVYALR